MSDGTSPVRRVPATQLQAFIERACCKVGIPVEDAAAIGELMARADVNGSEGHGIFRLPQYIRRIKAGAVNVRPNIRIVAKRRPWRWSTATTAWATS